MSLAGAASAAGWWNQLRSDVFDCMLHFFPQLHYLIIGVDWKWR
jgi:hypothetical protein